MASHSSTDPLAPALNACDQEPIQIPGAIQPHGLLLVADPSTLTVVAGAGDIEGELSADWLGTSLAALIGAEGVALAGTVPGPGGTLVGSPVQGARRLFELAFHRTAEHLLVELEPADEVPTTAALSIARLDSIAAALERSIDLA